MPVLIVMFQHAQDANNPADLLNRCKTFMEHALRIVIRLIYVLGPAFSVYLDQFLPLLIFCLQYLTEPPICSSAVRLLVAMANKLPNQLQVHLNQVFPILLAIIGNPNTDRSLISVTVSAINSVTISLGASIFQYQNQVMVKLIQAYNIALSVNDYLILLQCAKAFIGIIVFVLVNDDMLTIQNGHVRSIIDFLSSIAFLPDKSAQLIEKSCDLVNLIANLFEKDSVMLLDTHSIKQLLKEGRQSDNAKTKKSADRATNFVNMWRNKLLKHEQVGHW